MSWGMLWWRRVSASAPKRSSCSPIGGISRPERTPKAREELWIALAGPAVNLLIAGGSDSGIGGRKQLPTLAQLIEPTDANLMQRIALGNLILAAFNILPAYPMDGGRVLRSLLARWRPEDEATRITASIGQALAAGLGLFGLLSANFMLVFVAMFVYLGAAQEGSAARDESSPPAFPCARPWSPTSALWSMAPPSAMRVTCCSPPRSRIFPSCMVAKWSACSREPR